ncbi:hypothetical protein POL68_21470 [Stigmatella sp. ncwal1]|uniref:Uncharacterized protein n=1 Tax=Stigmatella ashevillensis TaxID=2995309 RepID=A0ABT5DBL4_9BACT|nr:hypothetical protein [Stigmatella ashevillena]MDC0711055.1 hypothetical protein [Stigmatella ashevillena]
MCAIPSASRSQTSCVARHLGNQVNRIQKGLGDGTLTLGEAGGLAAQQTRIAEAGSRALADGKLDRGEFKELRQMQRSASRDIFEQRHNASERPAAPSERAPRIDSHQNNQGNRIEKGLGDGSLTADEARGLMDQQSRIAEAKGRALADGTMDEAEYTQLRELQRQASRDIFSARHNCGIRG